MTSTEEQMQSEFAKLFVGDLRGFANFTFSHLSEAGSFPMLLLKAEMVQSLSSWEHAKKCAAKCESPIEQMLLVSLVIGCFWKFGIRTKIALSDEDEAFNFIGKRSVTIRPQAEISGYRADFRVQVKDGDKYKQLLVECDGHDFHEKTKEQAKKDKTRDRELQKLGYRILRFTGSEIWNNPIACALETSSFLHDLDKTLVNP